MQGGKNQSKVLFEVKKMTQFEIMKILNRMIQKTDEVKLIRTSSTLTENFDFSRKKEEI